MMNQPAFKLKNANFNLFVLHIQSTDIDKLKNELEARFAQTPDFFCNTPVVLGLAALEHSEIPPPFVELIAFTKVFGMCIAGIQGGNIEQRQAAVAAGLGLFPDSHTATSSAEFSTAEFSTDNQPEIEQPVNKITAEPALSTQNISHQARPTMLIDKPVRTGQRIYAEGANLVVMAIVNAGAELIADGDIHIYAPFRGRAIAGAHGNPLARIFVQRLEAELISIAGCFQIFEHGVPESVRGKPAQIHLEGSKLIFDTLPG